MSKFKSRSAHAAMIGALTATALSFVISTASAQTTEPACTLTVENAAAENPAWVTLGYRVVEKKDASALAKPALAALLTNKSFVLRRQNGANEMLLSTTEGRFTEGWIPLSVAVPAAGQALPPELGCGQMRARVAFYRETRAAVTDVWNLAHGYSIGRTRGEAILDLERGFYVHQRIATFENQDPNAAYLELLKTTREIANQTGLDFFQRWQMVREAVFDSAKYNLEYCRDKNSMTQALLAKCTNCVGETYLLFALFEDAGFVPPPGWKLGVQLFTDHVRPVVFNSQTQRTVDLTTGGEGPYRAAIMDKAMLYRALWNGHEALRTPGEIQMMRATRPVYEFQNWTCVLPLIENRPADRPADFYGVSACERFSPEPPPEFADNQPKSEDVTFAEDANLDAQGYPLPAGGDPVAAIGDALSGALGGLLGGGNTWMGEGVFTDAGNEEDFRKQMEILGQVAGNLTVPEGDILRDAIKQGRFTGPMKERFSLRTTVGILGYGYLENLPEYQAPKEEAAWTWDTIVMPLFVTDKDFDGDFTLYDQDTLDILVEIGNCFPETKIAVTCIGVRDPEMKLDLENKTSAGRLRYVIDILRAHRNEYFAKLQPKTVAELADLSMGAIDPFWEETDAVRLLPRILREGFRPEGTRVTFFGLDDAKVTHPLHRAIQLASHWEEMAPATAAFLDLLKSIGDNPVEIFTEMEKYDEQFTQTLFFNLGFADSVLKKMQDLAEDSGFYPLKPLEPWKDQTSFLPRLLVKTLTHPDYFFTVQPERKEVPDEELKVPVSLVAANAKSVRDGDPLPEVIELENGVPVWIDNGLAAACANGATGYQTWGDEDLAIVFDCGAGSGGETKAKGREEEVTVDPREEIHLKPATWKSLLLAIAKYDSISGVMTEPVVKVLLHHTLRKKLHAVYGEVKKYVRFMVLDPVDLDPNVDTVPRDLFEKALRGDQDAIANLYFVMGHAEPVELFEGYGEAPFMKAALYELDHGLKKGYLRFERAGISTSSKDALKAVKAYLADADGKLGEPVTAPAVFQGEGGRQYSLQTGTDYGFDLFHAILAAPLKQAVLDGALKGSEGLQTQTDGSVILSEGRGGLARGFTTRSGVDIAIEAGYLGDFFGKPRVALVTIGNAVGTPIEYDDLSEIFDSMKWHLELKEGEAM